MQETTSVTFNDVNSGEELLELPDQVTIVNYSPILNVIITNTNLENIKLWGILQYLSGLMARVVKDCSILWSVY